MTIAGATSGFSYIDFVDASVGWVAGGAGVARTVDGGDNWTLVRPAGEELNGLCATDAGHAWVTGRRFPWPNTIIFVARTTDGGATWTEQAFPASPMTPPQPGKIAFSDDDRGYTTMAGTLYQTADGGVTWLPSSLTWRAGLIEVLDAQRAWVVASDPVSQAVHIWRTTDGGAKWIDLGAPDWSASSSGYQAVYDLQFTDQSHGFLL
jgi:photosystem II stability/assembly factor-like uncharacterized protein